jgi:AcrR family transcriptional regulator
MAKQPTAAIDERISGRPRARSGRPPRESAGEVDVRILDAARQVFLHRGFEGASIEEIAEVARAGKPTIYARHPSKRELFTAVVARNFAEFVRFEEVTPVGATVEERLGNVGIDVLEMVLRVENIGLCRASIAEVRRFPDLAKEVSAMARERGTEAITRLLGEMAESGELHALRAFGPDRLRTTARFFLDLVVLPLIIRALFGESVESLCAEIPEHVSSRVSFFLAACRHGTDD